ncbi:MAG TPA: lysophospholipid acyltransferase family protein [Candidatus Binatia bacterium]|nr:lysophospholipid acyltransferase family protein [Candidatus Binatia bacterium]
MSADAGLPPSGPLNRAWRIFGTGFSFVTFGVAGFAAGFTLFPLLCLTTRDPAVARRRAQWLVHWWFGVFAGMMERFGLIAVEVRGEEKLRAGGALIIANHPTLIDVVLLIARMPQVDCIVKPAIFDNPFMRWPARWAGYVCHRTPEQLIADCTAALRAGHSLLVFPESTRTRPGEPIRMMHGAARVALESGAPVLPVAIDVQPLTLTKGLPWYRVPPRTARFVLTVGEPCPAPRGEPGPAAARRLTHQWERWFAERTGAQAAHPAPPHESPSPLADAPAHPQYSP